jgi:hypothetical protein
VLSSGHGPDQQASGATITKQAEARKQHDSVAGNVGKRATSTLASAATSPGKLSQADRTTELQAYADVVRRVLPAN